MPKPDKAVFYQCPWKPCGLVLPEADKRIQQQKRTGVINCPECGTHMIRKVFKERRKR